MATEPNYRPFSYFSTGASENFGFVYNFNNTVECNI